VQGLFAISFETQDERARQVALEKLRSWRATEVHGTFWLIEADNTAAELREFVGSVLDSEGTVVVVELRKGMNWSLHNPVPASLEWLRTKLGPI